MCSLEKQLRNQHSQLRYLEARTAACKQPYQGNPSLTNETLVELFQQAALAGGLSQQLEDNEESFVGEPHGISSRLVAAVLAIGEICGSSLSSHLLARGVLYYPDNCTF